MAILITAFFIPMVVLYLLTWWIGRNWPAAGTFICKYKYLFALLCLFVFGNSMYSAMERGQKGFGVGALSFAVAFAFLPSKKRFQPKKSSKKQVSVA